MSTSISRDSLMAAFGESPMVLPGGIVHGTDAADWPVVLDALSRAGWPARWNSPGTDTDTDGGRPATSLRRDASIFRDDAAWDFPMQRREWLPVRVGQPLQG